MVSKDEFNYRSVGNRLKGRKELFYPYGEIFAETTREPGIDEELKEELWQRHKPQKVKLSA